MTVLPPRWAFSRRNTTRPNLDGLATSSDLECAGPGGNDWPGGSPAISSAPNGLLRPAPVGVRSSFCFLAMRLLRRQGGAAEIRRLGTGADHHRFDELAAFKQAMRKAGEPRAVR